MKAKKKRKPESTYIFHRRIMRERGRKCEICHKDDNEFVPLYVHYIDRDPSNRKRNNTAVFCPPCGRYFTQSNPEGLRTTGGLYAFAINRGLYTARLEVFQSRGVYAHLPACK